MPDLHWTASAISDLRSIVDYISDDSPDAALALLQAIKERVDRLTELPQTGRIGRVAGTRELVVRPNYVVVYEESSGTVEVLRVLHAARQWP